MEFFCLVVAIAFLAELKDTAAVKSKRDVVLSSCPAAAVLASAVLTKLLYSVETESAEVIKALRWRGRVGARKG